LFFDNAGLLAKPAKDLDVRLPLGFSWSSVLAEFWMETERNSILNLGTPTRTSSSSISLLESVSRMPTMARQWYVSLRCIISHPYQMLSEYDRRGSQGHCSFRSHIL